MTKVRAIILAGNGINCEMETAHACRKAGADEVDIVYLWDLAAGEATLEGYQFMCCPGGFLDGDDLGSARAQTIRLKNTKVAGKSLFSQFTAFIENGGLILGICNGFQLMIKLGLLPNFKGDNTPEATLTWNDSGRFEDRWVKLKADPQSNCVFTKDIDTIELPIRHGEGKIVAPDEVFDKIVTSLQAPLFYVDENLEPTVEYPQNPNGTKLGIAGLSDKTGRLMGLMPHPEAFLHKTNHPQWTRSQRKEKGDGLLLFENAVEYIRKNG